MDVNKKRRRMTDVDGKPIVHVLTPEGIGMWLYQKTMTRVPPEKLFGEPKKPEATEMPNRELTHVTLENGIGAWLDENGQEVNPYGTSSPEELSETGKELVGLVNLFREKYKAEAENQTE